MAPPDEDIRRFVAARGELTVPQRMIATAVAELTHASIDRFLGRLGGNGEDAERDDAVAAGVAAFVYAWQRAAARGGPRRK